MGRVEWPIVKMRNAVTFRRHPSVNFITITTRSHET
jgi:hypothetical protein